MLWTDSQFITAASLAKLDSDISLVATDETLTLDGADGIIRESLAESGNLLLRAARTFDNGQPAAGSGGLSAHHIAAVMDTGIAHGGQSYFHLNQVVVDDVASGGALRSAVNKWVSTRALADIYAAAVNRRVDDDRYADKTLLWRNQALAAWRTLAVQGIPIVYTPAAAPGAAFLPDTGSFAASDITQDASSGSFLATTYYLRLTYTGSGYVSASERGNAESGGSAAVSLTADADDALTVSIANLMQVVPTISAGLSRGVIPWMAPTGWNIYLGTSEDALYLQNSEPIAIATQSYQLTAPVLSGVRLGLGQYPDTSVEIVRRLRVG